MFDFLSSKFSSIFSVLKREKHFTESDVEKLMSEVHDALIEADVPYDVAMAFVAEVKRDVVGKKIAGSLRPDEQFMKIVHDKVVNFLGGASNQETVFAFQIPSTIMVMGLQGSGKTTTVSKLAAYVKDQGKKRGKERRILLASVDFYRPAAIDQLEILAKTVGVDFYRAQATDPVVATREIKDYALKNSYEILMVDTAGRLHVDQAMVAELKKVDAELKPKYKFMVLDAMTGQESLSVAKTFNEEVGFVGAVVTKMDSAARGGGAFAFRYVLQKPILFVGTGEHVNDFELFRPERVASRILDMGDILTLVERAHEKIEQDQQQKMSQAFESGNLTLQDFADQLAMVSKLGSLSSLMKYMPGIGSLSLSPETVEKGEVELKRFKTIIASMTPNERLVPAVLNKSRKQRVAKGAGVTVNDVDMLLTKFEQSKQFVKLFKKIGRIN
jgi:signal recognition particle subunit SRP54